MSSGLTSRMKGQRGEREVASILRRHGFEARRGTQTRGGTEEPDVVCDLPGHHIEVKRQERLNIWAALEQADNDIDPADDDTVPAVVFRRNRSRWYVCLPFEDYLQVVGK